jgi:hypothetical protein
LPIGPSTQTSIGATTIHAKFNMGAFTIKGAKDYVYTHKILHPHDFEK